MIDQQQSPQAQDAPAQGPQMQVAMQLTPQGLTLTVAPMPITIGLPEEVMHQVVKQWLATHDALLQEIVRESVAAKRQQLEIIRHVNASKL